MSRSFIFNIQILLLLLTSCQQKHYLSVLLTIIYPTQYPNDKITASASMFRVCSSTKLTDFLEY